MNVYTPSEVYQNGQKNMQNKAFCGCQVTQDH